jgi:hypothetical protein
MKLHPSSAEILFGLITKSGFATIVFHALYFPYSSVLFGRHSSRCTVSTAGLVTGFRPVISILIMQVNFNQIFHITVEGGKS